MAKPAESLICPITLELFHDPVLAQDGHTYEREAIENWIRKNGTSPTTGEQLSLEHLYPNNIVKKLVGAFETLLDNKNYQFILDVDVKKKKGRPLFQTFGKAIYQAEWLPTNSNQPEIIILKIEGAHALKEASFYVNLTRHPNVVRTFGFVLDRKNDDESNSIMLLQEYASEGSLYDLLQGRDTTLDEKILIEIFLQIIDAMIFLSYNHVVHGDLACRNVLVFRFDETNPKNIVVKVTDFGLSRQRALYSKTSGSAQTALDMVPTRYVAPEILSEPLKSDNYTEKSDVYSMGILMWEAYSQGSLPWSKIRTDAEVILNVMNNVLLPQPSNCSPKYWNIITKTWSKLPSDRPTFEELKRLLIEQIYVPVVNPAEEQRTTESNIALVKLEGENDLMASQPRASTDENLSDMKCVLPEETIGEQNNKSTPTQTKITQANVAKTAVLSQNNRATTPTAGLADMNQKREYVLKVLVIGEMGTGKTTIVKRYAQNLFSERYRATIGFDFALKIVKYDDDTFIRLQLWDIAGQERYGIMTRVYYKKAVGCFIVFDATRESTFKGVTKWKTDLDNKVQLPDGNPIPCVLLANKCDLPKEGSVNNPQEMDEFCREKGFVKWFETSAKENINIEASTQFLISEIMKHTEQLPLNASRETRSGTLTVLDRQVEKGNGGRNCCAGDTLDQ